MDRLNMMPIPAIARGAENNRVIIRIWTSEYNKVARGLDVGHISIEIPILHQPNEPAYYSLWPNLVTRQWIGYLNPVPGFYMKGYRRPAHIPPPGHHQMPEYDFDAEERPPEVTICFYCLDIVAMQQKFLDLKREITAWVMIGKNVFRMTNNDACSCTSLAAELLTAGGLQFPSSSSRPPDFFVSILHAKRLDEIAEKPNTQHYSFDEETNLAILGMLLQRSRTCNIL